jgi:hypothetical protein
MPNIPVLQKHRSFTVMRLTKFCLSPLLVLAYIIAQGWIPAALAYNVGTQHVLSVSGKDWLEVAEGCKKELELAIDSYKQKIKDWEFRRTTSRGV